MTTTDAHATARARGAGYTTHFTVTANGWVIDNQTGEFSRLNQESDMPEMTDVTSPAQLRHNGIVALLTEIRDRLPEREVPECGDAYAPLGESCTLPSGHGGRHDSGSGSRWWYDSADAPSDPLAEPAPADDLPGEPVEPGDLRAGDVVAFTYDGERIEGPLVRRFGLLSVEMTDHSPIDVRSILGRWATGISDVRLIERAPREDESPDEALARVIFGDAYGSHEGLRLAQLDVALMAREHIEANQLYAYRTVAAERDKAEAERDALRERLDALRADVESLREAWRIPDVLSHAVPHLALDQALDRDDERAAKGEQR